MKQSSVPDNGYDLYFDEREGMVRIRFFEILGQADPREGEEQDDSVRFCFYDIWEYDINGIEDYVRDNSVWLLEKAKEEERQALALEIKAIRNDLLVNADYEVNKASDTGDQIAIGNARAYRQALRDVPEQEGFPYQIDWPRL